MQLSSRVIIHLVMSLVLLTVANSQMFVLSLAGRFDLNPRQDPMDASSGNQRVCADRFRFCSAGGRSYEADSDQVHQSVIGHA